MVLEERLRSRLGCFMRFMRVMRVIRLCLIGLLIWTPYAYIRVMTVMRVTHLDERPLEASTAKLTVMEPVASLPKSGSVLSNRESCAS
jgi:hypothetical protein